MADNEEPTKTLYDQELDKIPEEELKSAGALRKLGLILGALMSAMIRALSELVLPHFFNAFRDLFKPTVPYLAAAEDKGWDAFLEFLNVNNIMNPELADKLLRFRNLPFPVQSFFNMAVIGNWMKDYIGTLSTATLANLQQNLNAEFSPSLPDANAMIQTAFIAPEKTTEVRDILKRLGFSDDHIDLLFISAYRMHDPQTIQALYLRGEMDEVEAITQLEQLGYTGTRCVDIMKLWEVIPPVQDIITMAVKEAFSPEIAEKFGQYEDFPKEFGEWTAKMGLTKEWAERYWAAHWQLPSLQMGYEMLHRGVITQEELALLMKAQDVMPFWREKLQKISFSPYTRIDLRRMHDMGVVTDDELVKNYMEQGYDEEHARKMAEFTIAYNRDNDKKITQAAIIKAYRSSILTKDDTRALLAPLKYTNDQIDFMIASADFDEEIELQNIYIASIKTRFVGNLWDDLTTQAALMKLNLPGARITALMEQWTAAKMVDVKMPSKTDMDKFYKNNIVTEDEYKTEMYRLGYSFSQVEWYLKLNKLGTKVVPSA